MKKALMLAAILALVAFAAVADFASATSTNQPGVKVSATDTNTATDFAADVRSVCIFNSGASEIFYAFNAAAVATVGTNELPSGATICFSDIEIAKAAANEAVSAIVGIVCAAGETATVYLYAVTR